MKLITQLTDSWITFKSRMAPFLIISSALIFQSCGKDEALTVQDNITFTSSLPQTNIVHNRPFEYSFNAVSENGAAISYRTSHPDWLEYDEVNGRLHGTPGWENLNSTAQVSITATNTSKTATFNFVLEIGLGEIICESDFGLPAESAYILPYSVGESYRMWQSYCHPQWSHKNWFSYDFEMPMGTKILASRAGTVIFERDHFEDGTRVSGEENFVFIEHEDGTVTHYIHIMKDGSLVNVGQLIEQGDVIALSGDSGGSAGPHLHTSLFIGKTNFDRQYSIPMNYSNADGPVNEKNGLIIDVHYTAKEF